MNSIAQAITGDANARALVLHIDDVGMCHGANVAFLELARSGGVTCGSIMVPCPWFREIASAAAQDPAMTDIGLDLGRFVLMALDLMLVSAILEVAVSVREPSFTRLATVAALRVALTILLSFEVAYQADTGGDGGQARSRSAPRWEAALRRQFGVRPAGRSDDRPWTRSVTPVRHRRAEARPAVADQHAGENVWRDRARLGRD